MPSLNTGNAILSNPIKVDSSYNVGIGGAASGSFKLQVTGTGNFTGALSGTSASFSSTLSAMSSNIQFNLDGTFGANYYTMGFGGVSNGFNRISGGTGTTDGLYITSATGRDIVLRTNGSGSNVLVLASTGAATFSNSFTTSDTSALFLSPSLGTNQSVFLQLGKNIADTYNSGELSFKFVSSGSASNMVSLGFYGAGQKLNVLGNGNVGIGTSSPSERLHLANTTNGFVGLRLEGTGTYAGSDWTIYASSSSPSSADDFLGFFNNSTTDGATADYKLRIFKNGNVGIGTSSPNLANVGRALSLDATTQTIIELNNSGARAGYLYNDAAATILGEARAIPLLFRTQDTERMRITSDGNVGINTSTPSSFGNYTNVTIKGGSSGANLDMFNSAGTRLANFVLNGSTSAYIGTVTDIPFDITQNDVTRIRVASGGNVGIGAADSIVRLNVVGASATSSNFAFYVTNSTPSPMFFIRNDGYMSFGLEANSPYNIAQSGRTCILASNGSVGYLSSTRESKTNIENLNDISWLYQLNPVSFNYRKKDDENNYTNQAENDKWYGLIADEVEGVNEDLVFYKTKEDKTKELAGVEYNKLIAALVKSVQELKAEIEAQQQQINSLINR